MKTYTVIWHYKANYGVDTIQAKDVEQALLLHPFSYRKDITLYAFPTATSAERIAV